MLGNQNHILISVKRFNMEVYAAPWFLLATLMKRKEKVSGNMTSFSEVVKVNPLNANPEKWSNILKQIVDNLPTICLSVFDHFMNLALKGLIII